MDGTNYFKQESSKDATPFTFTCEMETGASLTVKNKKKPCTGELYARFNKGALRK